MSATCYQSAGGDRIEAYAGVVRVVFPATDWTGDLTPDEARQLAPALLAKFPRSFTIRRWCSALLESADIAARPHLHLLDGGKS